MSKRMNSSTQVDSSSNKVQILNKNEEKVRKILNFLPQKKFVYSFEGQLAELGIL